MTSIQTKRFQQMRQTARRYGKAVPSYKELEQMPGINMLCPDCGIDMKWTRAECTRSVVTLQHYRDGTMALVCFSCNSRHRDMPGDLYRDMPKDSKLCAGCQQIKKLDDFHNDFSGDKYLNKGTYCKTCATQRTYAWNAANRDKYNERQRNYRLQRKINGNPVKRKPRQKVAS
jgi:hypothetical protein